MDLHPVIIHFPIALLTIYALLEIIRIPWLTKAAWYFPVKATFVFIGWLGAAAAVTTGLTTTGVPSITGEWPKLLATHKNFGLATVAVFGVIAIAYLLVAKKKENAFTRLLMRPPVLVALAIVGLACVTITGALGGAMIYGADVDPAVRFIYDLLIGG